MLTNGLWTEHVDGATWAADVAAAGAAAIGFGLADHHPEVPADLRAACEELGLPLLEVPEDLSFSMIAAAAVDGGDPSGLRLQLSRTRRLLQRLGAGGGHAALLDFLRRETRLPVWLAGPGGRPPDGCDPVPDPELARARRARRPARRAAGGDRRRRLRVRRRAVLAARTAVLVGAPLGDIGDDARLVIEQVTAYVVLEDARARAEEEGRRTLAAELVELAWSGDLGSAPLAARLRALGFAQRRPLTVVASANDPRDVTYAGLGLRRDERLRPPPRRGGAARRVRRRRPHRRARGPDRRRRRRPRARRRPPDRRRRTRPRCGSRSPRRSPRSRSRAHAREGQRVVRHLDIGSHVLLLDFVDRQVLLSFRESVLGPLERWDREHAPSSCARCRRSWPTTVNGA